MLKLPIPYEDFNGVQVTETFYFNLSVAEVTEMELTMAGGLAENLKRIGESGNPGLVMSTFKDILLKSFGVRSEDGRRFIKSPALIEEFLSTGAYDVLYFRLVTDSEYSSAFIKGIMPDPEKMNLANLGITDGDKEEPARAIPQQVQQAAQVASQAQPIAATTAPDFFGQYEWVHNQLAAQDIDHQFIEAQFFKNLPLEQQAAMVKDLQNKLPQTNG